MTTTRPAARTLTWSTVAFVGLVLGTLLAASLVGQVPGIAARSGLSAAHPSTVASLTLPASGTPGSVAKSPAPSSGNSSGGQNASAVGVPGWDNVTNSSGKSPPGRSYGRSFAYDPVDQYLVMFGGYGAAGNYLADTWTYANGTWAQIHPHTVPIARDHSTLVWDPVDQYILMFGGSGTGGAYGDTWTFLHGNWTQLFPTTHPSARWASAMTWDAFDQEMVLFGGCSGAADGDTWTFLGGNWTQLSPTAHPSPRENVALRFDAAANETVLFGGDNYGGNNYGDTWEFQAGNWTQVTGSAHPAGRTMASFSYDAAVSSLVLFGGSGSSTFGDTWLFANGNWTQVSPTDTPPARSFGEMAYDPVSGNVVLWGGSGLGGDLTDTWVFAGVNLTATASATNGTGPLRVGFSASTIGGAGGLSYYWQFGDGNVSHEQNASNLYATAGRYMASITVTDANGSAATADFFLRVFQPLTASAVAFPTTGFAPLTVQCTLLASGGNPPYHVHWTAGAGSNASANSSVAFVYGAAGTFTAVVNVTDTGGASWNQSFQILVRPVVIAPLVSEIVASATTGAAPLTVWFTSTMGGGIAPYQSAWVFGDGASSTGTTVNHTFTAAADVTTTFTVTDARGITHASSVNITVGPVLAAAAAAPPSARANASVVFTGSVTGGIGPYETIWNFGDTHLAADPNTTHVYATPGQYVANFTVIDHRGVMVSQEFHLTVSASSTPPPKNSTTPVTSSSGGTGGLADSDVLALAIVGGAAMIAVALIVVRRMDR